MPSSVQLPNEHDILPDGLAGRVVSGGRGQSHQGAVQVEAESSLLGYQRWLLLDTKQELIQLPRRSNTAKVLFRNSNTHERVFADHLCNKMRDVVLVFDTNVFRVLQQPLVQNDCCPFPKRFTAWENISTRIRI